MPDVASDISSAARTGAGRGGRLTPPTALGGRFWAIFSASVATCLSTGATTPVLPQFIRGPLGGDAAVVGLVIGSGSVVAMVVRPLLGTLADRFGRRRVSLAGSFVAACGMVVLLVAGSVLTGTAGRILFGLGGAALNTATMAWLVDAAAPEHRGRALSIFGVSIWAGMALGPQLGVAALEAGGYQLVWALAIVLEVVALLSIAILPEPVRAARPRARERGVWRATVGAVLRPGVASALAWSGEGVVLAFLVLHLQDQGIPAGGVGGAASVFTLFALSVIAARVAVAPLIDRAGAAQTATLALWSVAAGLLVLGVASVWATAAVGAVLLGLGFAPLYPSLAVLATADLPESRRAAGIGIFTAFMDVGLAVGAILGGALAAAEGNGAPFLLAALAQLLAVFLLGPHRRAWRSGAANGVELRPPAPPS